MLIGALWLFAFRGKWAAVALLTVKPHLGLLSILSLRSWTKVALVTAAVLLLVGLSAAVFGAINGILLRRYIMPAYDARETQSWRFALLRNGFAEQPALAPRFDEVAVDGWLSNAEARTLGLLLDLTLSKKTEEMNALLQD